MLFGAATAQASGLLDLLTGIFGGTPAAEQTFGDNTINTLPAMVASTTPWGSAVVTRPFPRNLFLKGSHATTTNQTVLDTLFLPGYTCSGSNGGALTVSGGVVVCSDDDGGAGGSSNPNLIYRSLSSTKYYTASTSATDNLGWHFNNGFVSSGASSTISDALKLTNTKSCNTLDTDASGLLTCGTDEGGAGIPNLVYQTISGTKYYTASTSVNAWYFDDGFVSSASSSIAGNLRVDGLIFQGLPFGNGTSTFAAPIQFGTTTSSGLISGTAYRTFGGALESPGDGLMYFDNTSNDSLGLHFYSNNGASANSPLALFRIDNPAFDDGAVRIIHDGTCGGCYNLRLDAPAPQIEFVESDQVSPAGKFEWGVNGDIFYVSSRNAGDTSFENFVEFDRLANGGALRVFGTATSSFTGGLRTEGLFANEFINVGGSATTTILGDNATSTFSGGIFANAFQTNLPSCDSLDTDSTGAIICGSDANSGGSGVPNLTYRSLSGTKFYTASSSATDNHSFHFNNGFVSSGASSTISDTMQFTSTATSTFAGDINFNNGAGTWFRNGVLGVGSSSPAFQSIAALQRVGPGFLSIGNGTSMVSLGFTGAGSTGAILRTDTANGLNFGTNLTTRMTIASAGNVGIASTTPTQQLSVGGDTYLDGGLGVGNATTTDGVLETSGIGFFGSLIKVGQGTSTFAGGLYANDIRTNLPNCDTVDTDSTGALVCGTDANSGGGGAPNLIYRTLAGTKYYTASSSATDNRAWHFANGFVSAASSTLHNADLRMDTGKLLLGIASTTPTSRFTIGNSQSPTKSLLLISTSTGSHGGYGAFHIGQPFNESDYSFRTGGTLFSANLNCDGSIFTRGCMAVNLNVGSLPIFNAGINSVVQPIIGFGTTTPALSSASQGMTAFASDMYIAGGLGVGNATTADATLEFSGRFMGKPTSDGQMFTLANAAGSRIFSVSSIEAIPRFGFGTTSPWGQFAIEQAAGQTPRFPQFVVGDTGSSTPFLSVNQKGGVSVGQFYSTSTAGDLTVSGNVYANGLAAGAAGDSDVCITTGTGKLTTAGASTCVVSSRRFKDNIQPLDSGLAEVLKLKPVSFTYKNDKRERVGLIAEDMEQVEPRLVNYEPDGKTPKSISYEEYTALLTKAIQEQQKEIDELDGFSPVNYWGLLGLIGLIPLFKRRR